MGLRENISDDITVLNIALKHHIAFGKEWGMPLTDKIDKNNRVSLDLQGHYFAWHG